MSKRRPSMIDEMEFPNKTRQFLDFVGVTRSHSIDPTIDSSTASSGDASTEPPFEKTADAVDRFLPIEQIRLSSHQPRRYFSNQAMESLVASIQEHGILQPLLVRPTPTGDYELIAGERRYRAASQLALEKVPVIIRQLDDQDAAQVALLENLQREDLNPIEETEAILQLLTIRLHCSTEEVISLLHHAANLQKQGAEITNNVVRSQWETIEKVFAVIGRLTPDSFRSHRLPLLNLPQDVLKILRQGQIEYTKARIIAQLKDEVQRQQLLEEAVETNLSVREIKSRIKTESSTPRKAVATTLPHRMREVYRRVQQAKVWQDPGKAKTLEKLLVQLESLLE